MNDKNIKALCESCSRVTNHDVIHSHVTCADDDEYYWQCTYQIIRCLGCDAISFREKIVTEDDFDPTTCKEEPSIRLFPPRIAGRKHLEHAYHMPSNIRRIYEEVITAINNSSVILTAIGLRTLIEAICIDQKVKGRNLEKKIDGLYIEGVLSEKQAKILHAHRFLGNIATHEITAAEPAELIMALEIAETLLKTIYILPELEQQIKTGKKGS